MSSRKHLTTLTIFSVMFMSAGSCANSRPLYIIPARTANGIAAPLSNINPSVPAQKGFKPRFTRGKIIVDVYPEKGEGYIDIAIRISNKPKQWAKLKTWNKNRRFPRTGIAIPVPISYLSTKNRVAAVKELFKRDRFTGGEWEHRVTFRGETMWFIAETFAGDGARFPQILKHNGRAKGQALRVGKIIKIPMSVLSNEFQNGVPSHPDLAFEHGADGKLYGVYKLKRGEALYSAVIVRFTGRLEAKDVDDMARKLVRINNISDPRRIPADKKIRIPFKDLAEDFVTGGAPDREIKVARIRRKSAAHVILDSGHGGSDPGAIRGAHTEDELNYDMMLRIRGELEKRGAQVYTTISDPVNARKPQNRSLLKNSRKEYLNTTPRYRIANTRVSVNMRVYLVNAIYTKLRRRGIPDDNIFFISIHMDHLHPRLKGSMIYYPRSNERAKSFRARGRIYGGYKESKGKMFKYDTKSSKKAESYSYAFSKQIIATFKKKRIPVHRHNPIRPFVYRRNRKWTPGIIRYSQVPTSILLEVVNLANSSDFNSIKDYRFRQRVAESIASAIL